MATNDFEVRDESLEQAACSREPAVERLAYTKPEYNQYTDQDAMEVIKFLPLVHRPKKKGDQHFDWCGVWSTGTLNPKP